MKTNTYVPPTTIPVNQASSTALFNALFTNANSINDQLSRIGGQTVVTGTHSSTTTLTGNKSWVAFINASGGNATVNLPATSAHDFQPIIIQKTDQSYNTVTINIAGSDRIFDPANPLTSPTATSFVLEIPGQAVGLYPRSNFWMPLFNHYEPRIYVRAYRSGAWNMTTTESTLIFDTEVADTASAFNTGTGVFTAPISGVYSITGSANVGSSGSATGLRVLGYVNGSIANGVVFNETNYINSVLNNTTNFAVNINLAKNDTFEVRTASVTANIVGATGIFNTAIQIAYIGNKHV